jgi:ribonuclease D
VNEEIARLASAAGKLAVDTEFVGEGRYRTLLCLIQVAVQDGQGGERIELLDPLEEGFDGGPLADVLADGDVQVVVHAGRQDVALLRRRLGCEVRNVFDTQVAAGFAGMAAQSSYEALLSGLLGIAVKKSASFTRWDARPLSDEQLAYAREDVVHLLALAGALERRLRDSGRLEWAVQECEFLERASDERDLDTVVAKLPRIRGLNATAQTVARELVAWRERTAAARDKPVQSVLGDQALVEIAKRRPASKRALADIRGVAQNSLHRRAEEILEAVRVGSERPVQPLPSTSRPPLPDAADAPLIALSEALVRARAQQADLAYELLASRSDLQAIVTGERVGRQAEVRTLKGWRRELVGQELLDLLDGRVSLAVMEGRLQVSRLRMPG